tara:strand:- start:3995 stop:6049 length:2055 start_codon:yes stop_codon:yes gene_type:complete
METQIPMRKFAGFTPQQIAMLLDRKGLDYGSPAAARYLAGMTRKAEKLVGTKNFQEGGQVSAGSPAATKSNLNLAQSKLAEEQQKLSTLQQQLAALPTDVGADKQRELVVSQINQQNAKIAQAQAGLASASSSFGVAAVPTAAEAVGMTVSTPTETITPIQTQEITPSTAQDIATDTGQVGTATPITTAIGETTQTAAPTIGTAAQATTTGTAADVAALDIQPVQGQITPEAVIDAAQQAPEELAVQDVQAAETQGTQIVSPAARQLEQGETVQAVANAQQASQFIEGVEAATGAPSSAATVQGQLSNLMTQFEGDQPPAWAAGAIRAATTAMAQRGISASSMAGQAIVQAAMESSLPIAMADAQTVAQFETQSLSNKQQMAVLAAQQRAAFIGLEFDQKFQARVTNAAKVSDIANMNFSAEQQIALENARLAQTADLTNLSNRQAVIMAQAAAMSQADMSNLNNRQQAAVQNAQNFLQMDMANLDIAQQADMFRNQSIVQSLFSDAAANNAASQFNATSDNQTNQFFENLAATVGQFNSAQSNAMEQFNAGEINALQKFQAEVNNQRDQFNAQNQLIIAQATARWRQQLATINNQIANEANRQNALQANGLTQKGLDEVWQKERDLMAYAFASAEAAAERRQRLLEANLNAEQAGDTAFSSALGQFGSAVVSGIFGNYDKIFI